MVEIAKQDTKLPSNSGKEIGVSGTLVYSGYITNEEYNRDLTGTAALQNYDIMRRSDPTVKATLIVCKNPIISASWDVAPASDDDVDVEIADFVKRELFNRNINWPRTVRDALLSLDFGFSLFEIVYELTDYEGKPRIGLKKLATRKQTSIEKWETLDHKDGVTQLLLGGNKKKKNGSVSIPREKMIYVVNEQEGDNYEGISLLRAAYKPWRIKDALELMNAVALERLAVGVPIVKKGINNQTVNETELSKVRTAVRQMRANEESYIEVPDGVEIEMLDLKANETKDVLPTIEHQDTQITLSVLAQFLMLGSGQNAAGSRATSSDQSSMFAKSLEAVARTVQQAFQEDLVKRMVDLNYSNVTEYPKLTVTDIGDDDIQTISSAISSLLTSKGLTPNAELENRLRRMLSLPELSEDEIENYGVNNYLMNPGDGNAEESKNAKKPTDEEQKQLDKENKQEASVIADARRAQAALLNKLLED